jgi:hypothetical protein
MEKVRLVDVIPKELSGEIRQDREPNLAVDPRDPRRMVLSALTPCPRFISTTNAPIYVSTDSGDTWLTNCIVPGNDPDYGTHDITVRFASSGGILYAGAINGSSGEMNILRTTDFTSPTLMSVLLSRGSEDQPYTEAFSYQGDRVYVGNNNLANSSGQTAMVDWSLDAASGQPLAGFATNTIEVRQTCVRDLASVRPAIHKGGTVYVAFLGTEPGPACPSSYTANVVVVRDDHWGSGGFGALTDKDGMKGIHVATGLAMPLDGWLGQQRVGSQLSLAVDPTNSRIVYVAWGDSLNANFTLHVRNSIDGGKTWGTIDLKTVPSATNPSLAINEEGTVGFLYQKLVNPGTCIGHDGFGCWETHFEFGKGTNWHDLPHPLSNTPDSLGTNPLGDYDNVLAIGKKFYGAFSANNYPDSRNFYPGVKFQRYVDWNVHKLFADAAQTVMVDPSIDPFEFAVEK